MKLYTSESSRKSLGGQSRADGFKFRPSVSLSQFRMTASLRSQEGKEFSKKMWTIILGMTFSQWLWVIMVAFIIVWAVVLSILLLIIPIAYLNEVISWDRAQYLSSGIATIIRSKLERELMAAVQAQTALRAVHRASILHGASDTVTLERALVPIFAATTCLHEVEVVFPRESAISTVVGSTLNSESNEIELTFQSNSLSCYLYGMQGCLSGSIPAKTHPKWYATVMTFDSKAAIYEAETAAIAEASKSTGLSESGSSSTVTTEAAAIVLGDYELETDAGGWQSAPVFNRVSGTGDDWAVDTYLPVYNYLFRLSAFDVEDGAVPEMIGRVAVNLGALSGSILQDESLGPSGEVWLLDSSGVILAAKSRIDTLVMESSGTFRLKKLSEVTSLEPLAATLSGILSNGEDADFSVGEGETHAAVAFLASPMDQYAVLVMTPVLDEFRDGAMFATSVTCLIFAGLPYFAMLSAAALLGGKRILRRKKVKDLDSESDDEFDEGFRNKHLNRQSSVMRVRHSAIRHIDVVRSHLAQLSLAKRMESLEMEAAGRDKAREEQLSLPEPAQPGSEALGNG